MRRKSIFVLVIVGFFLLARIPRVVHIMQVKAESTRQAEHRIFCARATTLEDNCRCYLDNLASMLEGDMDISFAEDSLERYCHSWADVYCEMDEYRSTCAEIDERYR